MSEQGHPVHLPPVATMYESCRQARYEALQGALGSGGFKDHRWRVDRAPCVYALDAQGDRLNDGDFIAWDRKRSTVEHLLHRFPNADSIIVDSGINFATNKDALEAGDYDPVFWQAVIWDRKAPTPIAATELLRILRSKTAFTSFNDMFTASDEYRPSMDMRDPDMKLLADHYDYLARQREDDRRAYRYGADQLSARLPVPPMTTTQHRLKQAPISEETRNQLRRDTRDLESLLAAASRHGDQLGEFEARQELYMGQEHFELGCWLHYYASSVYKPEALADRIDCVRRIFEAGIYSPGYDFYTAFRFGERQFDTCFEMGDADQVVAALQELAKSDPEGRLAGGVKHFKWDQAAALVDDDQHNDRRMRL